MVAHLSVIGRGEVTKSIIEGAEAVQKQIYGPVDSLEQALKDTGDGAWCITGGKADLMFFYLEKQDLMLNLKNEIGQVLHSVSRFHYEIKPYNKEIDAWINCISVGT